MIIGGLSKAMFSTAEAMKGGHAPTARVCLIAPRLIPQASAVGKKSPV